ncbi:MAG: asparagine synthase (glutamine-hydrolyzing) [Gemmatimonadota bacterium]|nr:asparagine synthase (glutamine-hydrolyzing) [Gemmatimonadota bacterium]MDP6802759.1 asparagine synthase (glutamine-hydrolyzing) [Gemmatimonadota bacterium]MDP7032117.1 asparagine synthase (glutamine-hydrolyzing) [Gemmatimonadota bacterium]
MCGIAGIVPRSPADPDRLRSLIGKMTTALAHRGPDDEGFLVTPRIALGMRRLSIIDVHGGAQPITTGDGRRTIVYNGEVYNHHKIRRELESAGHAFSTQSDTEVVLHAFDAWGDDGIRHLEGMFAFAIWDDRSGCLTLARDWMGQKSLFFAETTEGWIFASEVKALLASGLVRAEVDLETLSHSMSLRYLPGRGTLFAGISKVPPAHRVRVNESERTFKSLWSPSFGPKHTGSETDILDELDEVLTRAVATHLESEVPLGAFLSGGIDSSLVVAMAAKQLNQPLRTFSIGVDDSSQSELPWARQVADRYATDHFEHIEKPNIARLAPRMVDAMDEPVDPLAAGVYTVSRITSDHVTVVLGGDGGDELFAGYDRYVGQELAGLYARIPAPLRRGLFRPLIRRFPDSFGYNSPAARLRWLDRMSDLSGVERYAESASFLRFGHEMKRALFTERSWSRVGAIESERLLDEYFSDDSPRHFLDCMLHADCSTRFAEHQLPIVDRMTMAFGLEARSPLLDRSVVNFARRIPASMHLKRRRIKHMLREVAARHLPKSLARRKKQGFGFPLALWFREDLRGLAFQVARDSHLAEAGILRRWEMERLAREHADGRLDHNYRLWMLFTLELWFRRFIEGASVNELEEWVDDALSTTHGGRG